MPSYQQQSSGYQNIPAINNHHEEEEEGGNHSTTRPPPMATGTSSFPGNSYNPSSVSSVVNHVERLINFILSKPTYIWLILAFLIMMITTSGFGTTGGNTSSKYKNHQNVAVTDQSNNVSPASTRESSNAATATGSSSTEKEETTDDEINSSQDGETDNLIEETYELPQKLSYLLSYPNSGTTYTTTLVTALANRSNKSSSGSNAVASNYRSLCAKDENGHVFPVFQNNNENNDAQIMKGPCYLSGPSTTATDEEKKNKQKQNTQSSPTTSSSILTVTHCGGRCPFASINCPPSDYIETYTSFEQACRTTSQTSISLLLSSDDDESTSFIYPNDVVSKAVHLYRDPLDNIVSRFHAARYEHTRNVNNEDAATSKQWVKDHPNNKIGFVKWCKANNEMFLEEEQTSKFFPKEIMALYPKIPCHDEFFRWIQFHNLANEVIEFRSLENVVVHYDEYGEDLSNVAMRLSTFLGYGEEKTEEELLPQFAYGNTYGEYYSEEEREVIWEFLRIMAHPEVWDALQFYHGSN